MRLLFVLCNMIFHLAVSFSVSGQKTKQDSLLQKINLEKNDSVKLWLRFDYAKNLNEANSDKKINELLQIKAEAKQKKYYKIFSSASIELGTVYYYAGNYNKSIAEDEELEELFQQLPNSFIKNDVLMRTSINLGASYSLINDLDNAQKYYVKAIEAATKLKDTNAIVMGYFNMAFVFIDIQEWQKAYDYLIKSISYRPASDNVTSVQQASARAAAICFKMGRTKEGLQLLKTSDTLLRKFNEQLGHIYSKNAIGEYYYSKGRLKEALKNHKEGFAVSLAYKDPYYIADQAREAGRIFLELNEIDSAKKYLQIAKDTAIYYKYLPKVRNVLNDWCTYYEQKGNYREAYKQRTYLFNFIDSMLAVQNHNRVLLFETRYETGVKENKIRQLENEKKIQQLTIRQRTALSYVLMAAACVILLVALLLYRNYKQKQKLQQQRIAELEKEKQLLAAAAILKGQEEERTRLAKDLHDGLGGMLSGIKYSFNNMKENLILTPENALAFERSMNMLDNSIKELRLVAHNMMPESLVKFGLDTALKDFCGNITASGALKVNYHSFGMEDFKTDSGKEIIIYRIIQELVNNTIKHAAAKEAIVQLQYQNNQLQVTVEDDGKGFDTAGLDAAKGIGWDNIKNRVEYLKGTIHLVSEPGKGTGITIEINI
jgi:two-component system, NarL family, sensor kinase